MEQGFQQFKEKIRKRVLVFAIAFGACCSLVLTGGLLVGLKLAAVVWQWYFYALTAFGAFVLAGGAFYLFARHNDMRLAVKMDKVYGLGESVQTMVEHQGERSGIIELQREATDEKIAKIQRKKPTKWHYLIFVLVPVLAMSTMITGLAVPQKTVAEPIPWEEQAHTTRESQINELKKIIDNVRKDEELLALQPLPTEGESAAQTADASLTQEYLTALEALLQTLGGSLTEEFVDAGLTNQEFQNAVSLAMVDVMDATNERTSYKALAKKLEENETVAFLGEALVSGAKAYGGAEEYTYAFVKAQAGETLEGAVKKQVQMGSGAIYDAMAACDWSNYNATIASYQSGVAQAIGEVGDAETDPLKLAFYDLQRALHILNVSEDRGLGLPQLLEYLQSNAVNPFDKGVTAELYKQSYYSLMKDYICSSLHEIFGVEIPLDSGEEEGGSNNNDDNNDDNKDDHEHNKFPNWPSNDLVIDVNGEKVHYGEILDEGNYAKILSLLDIEGLPQEVRDYIESYLDEIKSKQEE